MRPREYVYKKSEYGSLATHWSRLADVDSGSAVKTYRQFRLKRLICRCNCGKVMYLTLKILTLDFFIRFQKQHFCGRRFFQKLSVALMRGNCALLNNRASD